MSCFEKCSTCNGKGYELKTVLDIPPNQVSDVSALNRLASFFAKHGQPLEPYKEKTIKKHCSHCNGTGKVDVCEMEEVYLEYGFFERLFDSSLWNHSEYRCKKCGSFGGYISNN